MVVLRLGLAELELALHRKSLEAACFRNGEYSIAYCSEAILMTVKGT